MPQTCRSCNTPNLPDDAKFCPICGTPIAAKAASAAPAPQPPPEGATVLDGPRAIAGRFISSGAAVDGPTGSVVPAADMQAGGAAVRVLLVSEPTLPSQAIAERTLREWKQLGKVTSPKIVRIVDQGRLDDGKVYVASEIPRGVALDKLIATDGPLTIERARKLLAQVGEALTEAQKVGVIHRDVAPRNIFVDGDEVTVAEFGLAEAVAEKVFGSPAYLSPEQAEGKPVDQRSNIYSLGAVLYFMLTGRPPFEGDTKSLLQQHTSATPTAPSTHRQGLPPELDRIIMKALEKSGGRRHLTLRQLITEVEAVPAGSSVVRSAELGSAATLQPTEKPRSQQMQATMLGIAAPVISKAPVAAAVAPAATPVAPAATDAKTVMAEAPVLPTSPKLEPAVAATPLAAAAPKAGAAVPKPGGKPVVGANPAKKGFRETAWFKKGEIEEELAKAEAATGTEDPLAPSGVTGQRGAVDESGADLTASDAKRLSLKTGATQMMQAVKLPDPNAALPGDRMDEAEMIAEIDQSRRGFMIAGAIVAVIVIIVLALLLTKKSDDAPKGKSEGAAPKSEVTPPPAAPAAAAANVPPPPAVPDKKADSVMPKPSLLVEADLATSAENYVVAVDALVRANQQGADPARVHTIATTLQKALVADVAKAKKKKDHAAELEASALLGKIRPFVHAPAKKPARGLPGVTERLV